MDILAYPVCLFFVGDEIHVNLLSDNGGLRIWAGTVVSVENDLDKCIWQAFTFAGITFTSLALGQKFPVEFVQVFLKRFGLAYWAS